jgi:hypothetical protein
MDARQRADLDRYITGNYGEDQITDDEDTCIECGLEHDACQCHCWHCGELDCECKTCDRCGLPVTTQGESLCEVCAENRPK